MSKISITIGSVGVVAELLDTPTAQAIAAALPFASKARTWGQEVYFETPVDAQPEADEKDVVEAGELSFWCQGSCIAIGFGPTPASQGDEIRLAAPTNTWARALSDVTELKQVKADDFVFIEMVG